MLACQVEQHCLFPVSAQEGGFPDCEGKRNATAIELLANS